MRTWLSTLFRRDKVKTLEAITGIRLPSNVLAGVNITPENSLTVSAVWAAVSIISDSIAAIEFEVVQKQANGGRVSAYQHPAYDLVSLSPNEHTSAYHFKKTLMVHALIYGGGWAEIQRADGITPSGLVLLNPKRTCYEPRKDADGQPVLMVATESEEGTRYLSPANVLHIKGLSLDGYHGANVVKQAREAIGLALACEQFSSAFFGNGAWMGAFVETVAQLSENAQRQLVESLRELNQGPDQAHKLTLLPLGTKITPNEVDNSKAQLNELRQYQVLEVCRFFNIQPTKLFDYSNGTYSNFAQASAEFYTSTLLPWLVNIEAEYSRKLFQAMERRQYQVRHNATLTLLRGDPTTIADVCSKLVGGPVMTQNEGRALFGLNPVEGADTLLQPLNMGGVDGEPVAEEPALNSLPPVEHRDSRVDIEGPARAVVEDAIGQLVRRECDRLRAAANRPDALLDWCGTFYPDHANLAANKLRSPLALLRALGHDHDPATVADWVAEQGREAVEGLCKSMSPDEIPAAVERLCDQWTNTRAATIAGELLCQEGR